MRFDMAKRKNALAKSKIRRYDETPTTQKTDPPGVRLEQLCNERDVGMDGIIHWNDAILEEGDIYNFMGWFELEGYPLDKWFSLPDRKGVNLILPGQFDPFQILFKIMKVDESCLSPGNIYQSTVSFRYEDSGEEAQSVNELNLTFNDIENIGFAARSIQF
jgi:hypothetical protein